MPMSTLSSPTGQRLDRSDRSGLPIVTAVRLAIAACLILSVAFFVCRTIRWPLVNDPAQIDYMCFLMDHGRAPYKGITEMNMPGIYLTNWAVMHLVGDGAPAWRAFDLSLLAAMAIAMFAIAWPYDWLGGLIGSALFALIHGRDGPAHTGQRDLIIAVLLTWACAFLFFAFRKCQVRWFAGVGFCLAAAATIKPFPLVLVLGVPLIIQRARRYGLSTRGSLLCVTGGMLVPAGIVLGFLIHEHALSAFLGIVFHVLSFYSHIGRLSAPWLIRYLNPVPSLGYLALILMASVVVCRRWWSWECHVLVAGMIFGLFSWFAQGKGFPYHRYPLDAFLLLWAGIQLAMTVRESGWYHWIGWTGLAFVAAIAPGNAIRAVHREWAMSYIQSLTANLAVLGGSRLSGHVQCLATPADCDTTLYDMRLVQATGLSYDYFIFGDPRQPVIEAARARFWQELRNNPPDVFVVSIGLYPDDISGVADYRKLDLWPTFSTFLKSNYRRYTDREFMPKASGVSGYRIYVRRGYIPRGDPAPASLPKPERQQTAESHGEVQGC